MDYKVIITEDAEADMDKFVHYLLFEKKNEQAALVICMFVWNKVEEKKAGA